MTDEIGLLNLRKVSESVEKNSQRDSIILEKLLTNVLLGHFWTQVSHIKNIIGGIISNINDTTDIITMLTDLDPVQKKIRVKSGLEENLDPYFLYKDPSIESDVIHNIVSKLPNIDSVSGVNYSDLPLYLMQIQGKLFSSTMPNLLVKLLNECEYNILNKFIRPILKLILMNLMYYSNSINLSHEFRQKLNEVYIENKQFSDDLQKISQSKEFDDCKACIQKILTQLKKIKKTENPEPSQSQKSEIGTMIEESKAQFEAEQEAERARKRELAKKRQQQMMAQFQKKQLLFDTKNKEQFEKDEEKKSEEESDSIGMSKQTSTFLQNNTNCMICNAPIDEQNEKYGVLYHLSLTNNFYDINDDSPFEFKSLAEEYQQNKAIQWYPSFTSCGHHIHKDCFQKHLQQTHSSNQFSKHFLAHQREFSCPLCNMVHNGYIGLEENNQAEDKIQDENAEEKNNQFGENIQFILNFWNNQVLNFKNSEGKVNYFNTVILEEFIDKMNYHMFENLSNCQNSKEFLKRARIYSNIFRIKEVQSLKSSPKIQQESQITLDQNFESIFNNLLKTLLLSSLESGIQSIIIPTESLEMVSLQFLAGKLFQAMIRVSQQGDKVPSTFKEIWSVIKPKISEYNIILKQICLKLVFSSMLIEGDILRENNKEFNEHLDKILLYESNKGNSNLDIESTTNDNILESLEYLFDQVLNKNIKSIEERAIEELDKSQTAFKEYNSIISGEKQVNLQQRVTVVKQMAVKSIKLPKSFDLYNNKYFIAKCKDCKFYSRRLQLCLCLTCGDAFCISYCGKESNSSTFKGNLVRHSKDYHLGQSMFLEVYQQTPILICGKKNTIMREATIYTDGIGQSVCDLLRNDSADNKTFQFSAYQLNEQFEKDMKSRIRMQNIGSQIYDYARLHQSYYNDGVF